MKTIRFGLVGLGTIGAQHARTLIEGKVPRGALGAVCDVSAEARARYPGVPAFDRIEALIESGKVDAVLIATPHFFHVPDGIAALQAGLHVLVEKPMAVHKADCERLLAAYRPGRQVFAAMFNQRTDPLYAKLRAMIRGGELGALRRIQWTASEWFRSQAYYRSGGWRATWAGEGGGVLLNQCPHHLDLWQWMFGMPDRVRAFASIGRYHDIEVEDDVTAYFDYRDGATGTFIASTGEAPGTNRLEVVAEQGRVIVERGKLTFIRNEIAMSEFSRTTTTQYDSPPRAEVVVPIEGSAAQHAGIMANFVDAILDGVPLLAPAEEGIHSVELANAMLLSAFEDETITFPLDGERYEAWLRGKIAESEVKKAGGSKPANV